MSILNQNSSKSDAQTIRITKTIALMRKLTYVEKKVNTYYNYNTGGGDSEFDTTTQSKYELDDLD